jgi:FlaA1/EpsC-like NDP-sugar epimerase
MSAGRAAQFAIDMALLACAFVLAYLLRFDFAIPQSMASAMFFQLPFVVASAWFWMLLLGGYRRIWRFISLVDIPPFALACLLTAFPLLALRAGVPAVHGAWRAPYSVILMNAALSFMALMGVRIFRRMTVERLQKQCLDFTDSTTNGKPVRVALIGAGRAGVMAARELTSKPGTRLDVVGFLDDDATKQGAVISGIPVLGGIDSIKKLVGNGQVDEAIITIANAPREHIARIVHLCEAVHLPTRIIPALHEILSGAVAISALRPVQIEDLLGREVVHLDVQAISRFVAGKRVMVTGAGGSIGSEMVRQLHGYNPAELLLVERNEYALFEIHREMKARPGEVKWVPIIADAGNAQRMARIFEAHRPHVVIHAAAYKHVPMMEANEVEAIENNTLGTRSLAEQAGIAAVEVFVLISTDKAVNPTSVMGASKRLAEIAVQGLIPTFPNTRYVAVRFGNVLGSTGSVIPLFREQIAKGGPVTVTHPDMQRYFMTIPEASQLVLQAASMGQGGEIFVLDMGEPVRIADLAREMIMLSGFEPDVDIAIEYTGLRPGEKMFEELHTEGENAERTRHPMIFIGKIHRYPQKEVDALLGEIRELASSNQTRALRKRIALALPEARVEDA